MADRRFLNAISTSPLSDNIMNEDKSREYSSSIIRLNKSWNISIYSQIFLSFRIFVRTISLIVSKTDFLLQYVLYKIETNFLAVRQKTTKHKRR